MQRSSRVAAPEDAGAHAEAVLAQLRIELGLIRAALDRVERELGRLADSSEPAPARARPGRYYRLLIEVYERGPHGVGVDELSHLARKHGYDRRGLNGYFAGARAPLCRRDGRAHLTLEGNRLVNARLAREPSP